MNLFYLVRKEDVTGISGVGKVAQGVQFDSGRCVLEWLTAVASMAVYQSIDDVIAIHGHNGSTVVEWQNHPRFAIGQRVFGIIDNAGFVGVVKAMRTAHDHPLPEYLVEGFSQKPIWCWEGELFLETDKDVHPKTIENILRDTAPEAADAE
jgi:hypothetical protein